ncbi:adenomatous polyposis coli protein 2-like isoform X2 [Bolinopsis microptera]|uniref:adenomatous polyposis coli protein 2-like isoform X2 n=1 Tax=Bolinopsis microptera TaxID=2820187 RepID=UPI00307A4CEB
MANDLDLSEILDKVKATSFKDDESVMSEKANGNQWKQRMLYNNLILESRSGSDKTHVTSVSRSRSTEGDRPGSGGSRSTVHSSQLDKADDKGLRSDSSSSRVNRDLPSESESNGRYPARTQGHSTRYESSRSSTSSRHSSAHLSGARDDQLSSLDAMFDTLITMSGVPENAERILNSEGLDTLVATMYPESCHGCGTMPLGHIFHLAKRERKTQSMKAISDVYRNLGETGRKHYKVHRHASTLVRSLEGLMDAYIKLRTDPDTPLPNTQPLKTLIILTKLSFDEEYRTVMNDIGVIFAISEYIALCALYKPIAFSFPEHNSTQISLSEVVKYGCTALTNLTCGDQHVKTALSHITPFLEVLLGLLHGNESPDVVRVVTSLFRNLSWRASSQTKLNLAHCQVCSVLIDVGRRCSDASTMKVLTSSLWNLSAHNAANKEALCSEGLELIAVLVKQPLQRNTVVLENTLGILRNISSHIAQVGQYRRILRDSGVLPRLVDFLQSTNDTVIAMSCGALWNLSARSPPDQTMLREFGAVPLLRSLSLHTDKSISKSAHGALRNIMAGSSRSVSPSSHEDQSGDQVSDHVMPPTQFWFDDYSLISSSDSRSRTSTSPRERRKVMGRQLSKQHQQQQQQLRFSSNVDKFSC